MRLFKNFFIKIALIPFIFAALAGANECVKYYTHWSKEHLETQQKFNEILTRFPGVMEGLPENARLPLFRSLENHAVASLNRLDHYDPKGIIGFCFGRSFTAFLLELQMGMKITDIRNLFIIGDLRSGNTPEWRFHVTNVARFSDGRWYAYDPVVPQKRPIPIEEWVKTVRSIWDKKGKAKLYVTSPLQILPDIRAMAPSIEHEKGNDIIDITFDPRKKADIQLGTYFGDSLSVPYFEMKPGARPYFLEVSQNDSKSFAFDQIAVNGMEIPFNSFFRDSIESILNPNFVPALELPMITALSVHPSRPVPLSRYGMTFRGRP